jgi:hypothetical protein
MILPEHLRLHIQKIDKRFAGHQCFQYRVRVTVNGQDRWVNQVDRIIAFNMFRQWCIDSLGMSCERDSYVTLHLALAWMEKSTDLLNQHWAWHWQENKTAYFYFTESGMNWVNVKWS